MTNSKNFFLLIFRGHLQALTCEFRKHVLEREATGCSGEAWSGDRASVGLGKEDCDFRILISSVPSCSNSEKLSKSHMTVFLELDSKVIHL